MVAAHRFSYEDRRGPIPPGLFVCHHCDNRLCVRPSHLFLGTNTDNVRDMDRKGRRVSKPHRGSAHAMAKLKEEDVFEIARRHKVEGVTQTQLGRDFGVSLSTINHILTGRLWAHLGVAKERRA